MDRAYSNKLMPIYENIELIAKEIKNYDFSELSKKILSHKNNYDEDFYNMRKKEIIELRKLFPEFKTIDNKAIYILFDEYMFYCEHINGWEPYRANIFIFYVLGINMNFELQGNEAVRCGESVGLEILQQAENH